ncbi:MAG: Calx-beta domain-containing protein, partial [Thermodesulfobacteriota bacterium]
DETTNITLSSATGATLGTPASAVLTITDDDSAPTVAWTSASQSKPENAGSATITAQLSSASAKAISIPWTVSGTATGGGTDYSISASPLSIPAGLTSSTISVTLTNDSAYETPDETVIVTMGTPTNATQGITTTHTLTITNDDTIPDTTKPTVTITSPTSETTYSTTSSALSLSGSATDNISLSSVTWTSDQGGSGTATLTDNTWAISNITLISGQNTITVTATDTSNNIGTDMITITYSPASKPSVTTDSAANITQTTATLNGTVNPNNQSTTAYFQYGLTLSFGNTTGAQTLTGSTAQNISANITGLSANTTYYYRIVATNSSGTSYGSTQTFTTQDSADSAPPDLSIKIPTTSSTYTSKSQKITISGEVSDTQSGVKEVTYSLDSSSGTASVSGSEWTIKDANLNQGNNSVIVTATDNNNNRTQKTITVTYTPETIPANSPWKAVPLRS